MSDTDLTGVPRVEQIEFISLIGVGGMSRVYKARQTLLDRVVAVKVVSKHVLNSEVELKRFQSEVKVTSSLNHPNIVQVMNSGVSEDGQPYLVMEYLEGHSLSDEISKNAPLSYRRFRDVFLPLLSALDHAHSKGIIHRDIKPSNIIISRNAGGEDVVKLVDFGIAKVFLDSTSDTLPTGLTKTGMTIGSPNYMSPEQCAGQELDETSDLYSLSCVMFECLNCQPPYQALSSFDVMYKHMHEKRPSTRELSARMEIPQLLAKAILWGLNKEISRRPQSAVKFAQKLSSVLQEITLDKTPQVGRASAARKKALTASTVLASLMVLITVSATLSFVSYQIRGQQKRKIEEQKSTTVQSAERKVKQADSLFYDKGMHKQALKLYEEAIPELEQGGPPSTLGNALLMASNCVRELSDSDKSKMGRCLEYTSRAAKVFKKLHTNLRYLQACNWEIDALLKMHKFAEAEKIADETVSYARLNNAPELVDTEIDQIRIAISCGNVARARKLYDKLALSIGKGTNHYSGDQYKAKLVHAEVLSHEGETKQALRIVAGTGMALSNDRNVTATQRESIWFKVKDLLMRTNQAPLLLEALKKEAASNFDLYAGQPEKECRLRCMLADAYKSVGDKSNAKLQYLTTLRKIEKTDTTDTGAVRIQCLSGLVDVTDDDKMLQKSYLDELLKLKPPQ